MLFLFILTIWSWHIWVTERDLSSVEVTNFQNVTYKFLPVNLGWCGFGNEWYAPREVRTRFKQAGGKTADLTFSQKQEVLNSDYDIKNGNNPYYQWGRKDPMLPGNGIGDTDKTCFTKEDQYKFKYGSEGLNTNEIKEYIRNPHKFNINVVMDGKYYNLWSTDNARTDGNDDVVIKSVYDPSPVGYSLPASNAFTGFTTTGGNVGNPGVAGNPDYFNVKGVFDKGWYFYIKPNKEGKTFWIPANGFRSYITGKMLDSNKYGFILTSGISTTGRERLLVISSDFVMNITDNIKNDGIPVRSAEEKVLKCGLKKLQIVCSFGENCNITTLKIRILLYTKTYFVHFLSSLYPIFCILLVLSYYHGICISLCTHTFDLNIFLCCSFFTDPL